MSLNKGFTREYLRKRQKKMWLDFNFWSEMYFLILNQKMKFIKTCVGVVPLQHPTSYIMPCYVTYFYRNLFLLRMYLSFMLSVIELIFISLSLYGQCIVWLHDFNLWTFDCCSTAVLCLAMLLKHMRKLWDKNEEYGQYHKNNNQSLWTKRAKKEKRKNTDLTLEKKARSDVPGWWAFPAAHAPYVVNSWTSNSTSF